MDTTRIQSAGDPFYARSRRGDHLDQDLGRPHGCIAGVVYIGHMVEGEDGEEVEVMSSVPCRRCSR